MKYLHCLASLVLLFSVCINDSFGVPLLSGKADVAKVFSNSAQIEIIQSIEARDFARSSSILAKVPIDKSASAGETILWWHANIGDFEGFKYLLNKGANPLRQVKDGPNIMELCAMQEDKRFLREVVEFGGNLNLIGQFTRETPIFSAILQRRYSNVEFMLNRGACYDIADAMGTTPALLAADGCAYDILILLLKSGADPKTTNLQKYNVIKSLNEKPPGPGDTSYEIYVEAKRLTERSVR